MPPLSPSEEVELAKTTRIATEAKPRPGLFNLNVEDQTRTVSESNFDGVEWDCSRCGTDIEIGHMYRSENSMRRHVVCPRRRG